MKHGPLPPRARLLQTILSRRATDAHSRNDYYAIADMARGALLLAEEAQLHAYLIDIAADAELLATQEAE